MRLHEFRLKSLMQLCSHCLETGVVEEDWGEDGGGVDNWSWELAEQQFTLQGHRRFNLGTMGEEIFQQHCHWHQSMTFDNGRNHISRLDHRACFCRVNENHGFWCHHEGHLTARETIFNDSHFLSLGDMSGLMTIGEPREDLLFERTLVASAARMNGSGRSMGVSLVAVETHFFAKLCAVRAAESGSRAPFLSLHAMWVQ